MRRLLALALVACAPGAPAQGVRQSDIEAWRGAPVIQLETHALFSAAPLTRRRLSDGSEMWDYTTCRSYQEDMQCISARGAFGTVGTNCSGGGTSTTCCHNQFFVRGGAVESYRPVGRCYTDCIKRPGGTCDPNNVASLHVSAQSTVSEDPALVAARRTPRVPELGATLPETRALCEQQRGVYVNRLSTVGCHVGGATIFACTLDAESRADRCDGYYETADVATTRRAVEAAIGTPPKESVSADGFRVFEWVNGGEVVTVTMYAKGVRMTHARRGTDGKLHGP